MPTGETPLPDPSPAPVCSAISALTSTSNSALCISIHDVAPSTWTLCARLVETVRAVAAVPLTFLVVPAYHRLPAFDCVGYEQQLDRCIERGDELALHGYYHLDEAPMGTSWRERYLREVFTNKEGEFAALPMATARCRIALGLDWFYKRNWPVEGFVAPAWLMGAGSWQAVRLFPFSYTTTVRHFHLLGQQRDLHSPTLFYASRNAAGRFLSQRWNERLETRLAGTSLLRLALHPRDAHHPAVLRHVQRLTARLLASRTPMTKAAYVASLEKPSLAI